MPGLAEFALLLKFGPAGTREVNSRLPPIFPCGISRTPKADQVFPDDKQMSSNYFGIVAR